MSKLKRMPPYLTVTAIGLYLIPLIRWASGMGLMLFVIPGFISVCALIFGIRNPFHWTYFVYPVAVSALFAPTIPLFYNSTALVYVIIFGVVALAGCLFGRLLSASQP